MPDRATTYIKIPEHYIHSSTAFLHDWELQHAIKMTSQPLWENFVFIASF